MNKKVVLAIKIAAVIAFYVFLYIISVSHIQELKEFYQINCFNNIRLNLLVIAIILVIPNWLLESVKWMFAVSPIEQISLPTAIKGVLKGIPPSTFTPNRIGETVGRPTVLNQQNRIAGGFATAYSGVCQMPVMALSAAAAIMWLKHKDINIDNANFITTYWFIVILITIAILSAVVFYYPNILIPAVKKQKKAHKWLQKLEFFSRYNFNTQNLITIISIARYIVYCTQNYLLLKALGIDINITDGMAAVFITFGIISFVPRPALAELGVRCSVSALVLSPFAPTPLLPAAASALLWIINILIPCIIGTFFYIPQKKHQKNFAQ